MIPELWIKIRNELDGSSMTLSSILQSFDAEELEDDIDFLNYLDDEIRLCDCCGWWSDDFHLIDGEQYCDDCS